MNTVRTALVLAAACAFLGARPALAWEPFRSQNGEVVQGNEHLAKGQLPEAISAYDAAAKRLPNEPGVHLDRGIALLKAGKLPEARDALRLSTQGGQDGELRGKAHYNLGLTFLREADAAGKQENTSEAQKLVREAVDAFKSSLRASPKNRDAAWNLELSRRRLVELEKKQQEKQDQDKKKQEQEQQEDKPKQEQQDGEQGQDDKDNPRPDQDGGAGEQPSEQDKDQQPDQPDGEKDGGGASAQPDQPDPQQEKPQPSQQAPDGRPQQAMPEHMQKALDALEDSEENLQKHRAAMRARQRPRRVEKDW
jgi:Ca-activated chloride channel family protein